MSKSTVRDKSRQQGFSAVVPLCSKTQNNETDKKYNRSSIPKHAISRGRGQIRMSWPMKRQETLVQGLPVREELWV